MGKIFLKYTFDTQDETDMYEYVNLTKAESYRRLLADIFREIRGNKKHGGGGSWVEAYELIFQLANDEGIDPWEEIF